MKFNEKLKIARKEAKITQVELAKKLNVTQGTVANWERGVREPDIETIQRIATALNINIDTLFSDLSSYNNKYQKLKPPIQTSGKLLGTDTAPFHPDQMTPIPVVGKVAAGYTCLAEQYIEGYALADPDSLTDGYDYFWLRVTGDSMEPEIHEGDLVLVRVQEAVESGECAVVLVDEEDGLVKDIEIGKDHVTLCSKNPNYPPRVFVREEANRVRIVGKVVELKRMMR